MHFLPLSQQSRSQWHTARLHPPFFFFKIMFNFNMKGQGKHLHKALLINVNWKCSALERLSWVEIRCVQNTLCLCLCMHGCMYVGVFFVGGGFYFCSKWLLSCATLWVSVCLSIWVSMPVCLHVSVCNWPNLVCAFQLRGGKLLDWPL